MTVPRARTSICVVYFEHSLPITETRRSDVAIVTGGFDLNNDVFNTFTADQAWYTED